MPIDCIFQVGWGKSDCKSSGLLFDNLYGELLAVCEGLLAEYWVVATELSSGDG